MEIIVATKNKNKIVEIKGILEPLGFKVLSRDEVGVADFEIVEDGETFEANAIKKAVAIFKACHKLTIADDSGLEVDYLKGAPGVYSARFAGVDGDYLRNNEKLLSMLKGVPMEERNGKFVSVIAMVFSEEDILTVRGECEGKIGFEMVGENGFGYDPLFIPLGYEKSFGQLSEEVKNKISHRAVALKELEKIVRQRNKKNG